MIIDMHMTVHIWNYHILNGIKCLYLTNTVVFTFLTSITYHKHLKPFFGPVIFYVYEYTYTQHIPKYSLLAPKKDTKLNWPAARILWQYQLWSFQTRGTNLERFLPKNQHTQRKLLNFENWISMGLRSFQKSEF